MQFTWTCRQSIASCEKAEAADFESSFITCLPFHAPGSQSQYSNINYFEVWITTTGITLHITCTQVSIIIAFHFNTKPYNVSVTTKSNGKLNNYYSLEMSFSLIYNLNIYLFNSLYMEYRVVYI